MKDFKFNPRTGFLFEEVTGSSSGLYLCLAVYKNTTNSAVYKLTVLRKDYFLFALFIAIIVF